MPFQPHAPLPVEGTFDRFVDLAGGKRVSLLVGQSPPFANADYVFEEEQVVIELKELTTDWPQLEDFQRKMHELWDRCLRGGRITEHHFNGLLPIPKDVRQEFLQLLRKPIKRVLEKANRQIRDTHAHLEHKSGQGILFLVIDGLLSVAPQFQMALVSKILVHDYSSISAVVMITVNEYVGIPGDDYARLVWIPAYQESAPDSLVEFVDDLGRKWFDFLDAEVGGFDDGNEGADGSWIDGAHFVRSV